MSTYRRDLTQRVREHSWLLAALATFAIVLGSLGGCRDVPVDGDSGKAKFRHRDTIFVDNHKPDTVWLRDQQISIDTVFKEVFVRDTLVRIDTVVTRDTVARIPMREATIYAQNTAGTPVTVTKDIRFCTEMEVKGRVGYFPDYLWFYTLMPMSRFLPEAEFGNHGWKNLYINLPESPFRLGVYRLLNDPYTAAGAALTIGDDVYRSNEFGSNVTFTIDSVDYQRRILYTDFRGEFKTGPGPTNKAVVRVKFRLGY